MARAPGAGGGNLARPAGVDEAVRLIRGAAEPLPGLQDPAFARLFDRFADARVVLLGESTPGTAEFHEARARITERLGARARLHDHRWRAAPASPVARSGWTRS